MSDDTTAQTQTGNSLSPPSIAGGHEVYDSIMQAIEPDLVSANMDKLDALHPNETEAENKARMKRYAKAFEKYQKKYEEYRLKQTGAVRSFGKNIIKHVENKSASKEEVLLGDLEAQISQS